MSVARLTRMVLILPVVLFLCNSAKAQVAQAFAQLTEEEIGKIDEYKIAADNPEERYLREKAQREFGGRGPALAWYFLSHPLSKDNTAFYYLFKSIGDTATAKILIRHLPDPPVPVDGVLARHASEIEVAVGEILHHDMIRTDPTVLTVLEETLTNALRLGRDKFDTQALISLMGRLQTPEAALSLQRLADNSDPTIRAAAITAVGETGLSSVIPHVTHVMRSDPHPEVRSEAAVALARKSVGHAAPGLLALLEEETDLQVIDAILTSLVSLQGLPETPEECLRLAMKGWDVDVVRPYFTCWQNIASREALIQQAVSSTMPVRALALNALTERSSPKSPMTLVRTTGTYPLSIDQQTRATLLRSIVDILSQDMRGSPHADAISHETAYMTKEAMWEIAGHDMAMALTYADAVHPLHGHYDYSGRFGASGFLAGKNESAYSTLRRPGQMISAGLLALVCLVFLIPAASRQWGVCVLAGLGFWTIFMVFESGVEVFPPPPLWIWSVPFMAFLTAGLVSGTLISIPGKRGVTIIASPVIAGVGALMMCGYTRSAGWFPIGNGGWALFFDPIGCALLAAMASLIITLVWFLRERAYP